MKGTVEMRFEDIETGEVLDHYKESPNMVLDIGLAGLWQRLATNDEPNLFQFDTIFFGDDYGQGANWGIFNPEPPNRDFDGDNQNVVHELASVEYTTPTDISLRVRSVIEGSDFMNEYFPEDVDFRFTSMTLRMNNGTPFAFKRFPIRSISRFVRVIIDWRFTLYNSEEWCDPEDEGEE